MKKLLAIVISMAMIVAMMPIGVFGAVGQNDVAQIGDTGYATLQEAITAAENGDTIHVISDFTEAGQVVVPENKNITIDLGGKTITTMGDDKGIWSTINGNLTIQGEGYIGDATHNSVGYLFYLTGTLTLKGNITYESGLEVVQPSSENSKLYITDGYFIGGSYSNKYWTINKLDRYKDTALVEISGGEFEFFDPSNSKTENPEENWVKDGYCVKEETVNNKVIYKVIPRRELGDSEVAEINGQYFTSIAGAIAVASDGDTIKLIKDVTLDATLNINSGKIILDLSGKSINVTKKTVTENEVTEYYRNGITVSGSADLTITGNGLITGPSREDCKDLDSKALIEVQGTDANLTVLNGKISAGGVDDCGMYGIYVYDGGNVVLGNNEAGPIIETWFAAIGENNTTYPANITVNNGTYTENAKPDDSDWWAYFCAPIYAASSGDITINGGTFNGYYGISTRYKKVEQNITISGGTFNGSKSAIFVDNKDGSGTTEAREIVVKGGTFSTDPSAYVASGYYSAKNSDKKYTVYRYIPSTPSTPADNVTNNTTDKNTTADLAPAVKDNKAETTVDAKTADKIVDKAVANKSTEVIVDAAGNNTVASSEVAIPEKTVKEIAEKTDANLVIKTDNGKVDLDKTALAAVAAQAGTTGTVRLVVETVKTDENICHVDLKLITSNGAVKDFRGGNVKVTINLTKELAAKELVCVYIDDNGIYTLVDGVLNADGTYTFTTGHFSEYAVMVKAEADKKIAEQLNTLIKEVNLKVRTSKTAKKNIKAVVSGDVKALTDAGYTVKYKFYRSEKKASKYEAKATKAGKTYINTAGKKGTKYYYKAKALVYDGDKLVGQTVLTQCKYGVRTWSK